MAKQQNLNACFSLNIFVSGESRVPGVKVGERGWRGSAAYSRQHQLSVSPLRPGSWRGTPD